VLNLASPYEDVCGSGNIAPRIASVLISGGTQ
jgi:hypothetical protein